jgi:hypothetical protein
MVARGNYLAQDRCDIQYAVKELSRGMQNPTKGHVRALQRLGRYLIGRTRYVVTFRRQANNIALHTRVDTDRVGCLKTRKSTSGGITRLGEAHIKNLESYTSCDSLVIGGGGILWHGEGCFVLTVDSVVAGRFGSTSCHTHVH